MKIFCITVSMFFLACGVVAQDPIDSSKNGTIISIENDGNIQKVVREQRQQITIGNLATEAKRSVYAQPAQNNSQPIAMLKMGETIQAYKIAVMTNTDTATVNSWLYVSTENNIQGWINFGEFDPYSNNCWEIVERITNSAGQWTVRKLDQYLSVFDLHTIYSEPGEIESNALFTLSREGTSQQINFTVLAITEETDTIGDMKDHWLKIIDGQGRIGWIFGEYTDAMRGGPKYSIPEPTIQFVLGSY